MRVSRKVVLVDARRVAARLSSPILSRRLGPIVAMKLQAIMNRAVAKQGTDLQDILRLILDEQVRPAALAQLGGCDASIAADIALHVAGEVPCRPTWRCEGYLSATSLPLEA
jgi:hypothetical protein